MHFLHSLLLLMGTLVTISTANSATMRREVIDYITDGSFEDVPASDAGYPNINAGNWTIRNNAAFVLADNSSPSYDTPYGKQYVIFSSGRPTTSGQLKQHITSLPPSELTLSYAYNLFRNTHPAATCGLTVTAGSQVIDTLAFDPNPRNAGYNYTWETRSASFVPVRSTANLLFDVKCAKPDGNINPKAYFELHFDDVSPTPSAGS